MTQTALRRQVCVHVLALVLGAQANLENWTDFPRTTSNPNSLRKKLGKRTTASGMLNILPTIFPTYTWNDVLVALRSPPKGHGAVDVGGVGSVKSKDVVYKQFPPSIEPIPGVRKRRNPSGAAAARAPPGAAVRAPAAPRRRANAADDDEDEEDGSGDDVASISDSPPVRSLAPLRHDALAAVVARAVADPNAPRIRRSVKRRNWAHS